MSPWTVPPYRAICLFGLSRGIWSCFPVPNVGPTFRSCAGERAWMQKEGKLFVWLRLQKGVEVKRVHRGPDTRFDFYVNGRKRIKPEQFGRIALGSKIFIDGVVYLIAEVFWYSSNHAWVKLVE